jgi:hypothetical protein
MRKSRFSEEQMVKMVRECDHSAVAEVAKKHGVSEQKLYAWRKQFGSMEATDAKRLSANTVRKEEVASSDEVRRCVLRAEDTRDTAGQHLLRVRESGIRNRVRAAARRQRAHAVSCRSPSRLA